MKSLFKPLAIALLLAGCAATNEDVLNMPADEYLSKTSAHPFAKTETVRVSRSLAAVERSFRSAAASCLKQRHSFYDAEGGMGHVTVDHTPRVYRDATGVVLEIRQYHNGSPRRLFLAKARTSSGGAIVTMGGPKIAHNVIFERVGGYAQGRGGCFKYPSETGMLGIFG